MLTALSFASVLVLLILVHELGHFVTARFFGIRVMEFGLGYPPRLLSIKRGETIYSLNLLPLGGFVKLLGEEDPTQPDSLASKGVGTRLIVLSAGAFMNALLPVVIFSALFMVPQQTVVGEVVVREVVPDSPAARAGIVPGDTILKIDGHTLDNSSEVGFYLRLRLNAESNWLIQRGSIQERVSLVPRLKPPEGQGAAGIRIETVNPRLVTRSLPFWKAIPRGAWRVGEVLVLAKNEITGWIVGAISPAMTGPIGIAQMTGEVARVGIMPLLEFTALLSINLAIMNILPIPALDGGRLVFVVLEWVRRGKRIPPEKEGFVHMVGFVLLITLIVVISFYDIQRIFRGESLIP
ncbi:MAG: rane-associated zinc metalloprotease [Dehalococcoidia bacterium]|nr:rane-associated zinc metalloprotease [Dehalococcoidia bacterium]